MPVSLTSLLECYIPCKLTFGMPLVRVNIHWIVSAASMLSSFVLCHCQHKGGCQPETGHVELSSQNV